MTAHPDTIHWIGDLDGCCRLIEQTLLPAEFKEIDCQTQEDMWDAIKRLAVRGAPAIGVAAGFGTVLGVRNSTATSASAFLEDLQKTVDYLSSSRPTAVNLFWGLDRMRRVAHAAGDISVPELKQRLLDEAKAIWTEDRDICRRLGKHGAALLHEGESALTHCNAGGLATADYGTALAVFFAAQEEGKTFAVFADETRPLNQGSRLTSWELHNAGIDVTLICDNMAGQVMKEGRIQKIFVGSDRIAANGDAANKIGTYSVSVLAKHHGIPFYVVAPTSTFDLNTAHGDDIPIEQRDPDEIRRGYTGGLNAPADVAVYNPAFDVTPHEHIAGIVTEFGVIQNPDTEAVLEHFRRNGCLADE
ncbi:MAG: S-methyl-5-thioribose-1-phosphate isomerase [Planctomycetota bacterium]|jgi:methylthioribose-1-phosphate isomerase|nr:S-methyl-5-thioribose-1-phosphate isomerase [Planctomycetota bacterium]